MCLAVAIKKSINFSFQKFQVLQSGEKDLSLNLENIQITYEII